MGTPARIPPPIDPGIPTHRHGYQGRLFRISVPVTIPNRPDVTVESNRTEIFVPDTDKEYEPFQIVAYDLKGYVRNKNTNMKEPVIITINCNMTFWPPTRPGVDVPAPFLARAIQSNLDPSSRLQMNVSQIIDEYDIEIYPDRTRKPILIDSVPLNVKQAPVKQPTVAPNKTSQPQKNPLRIISTKPTATKINEIRTGNPEKGPTKSPIKEKVPAKEPAILQKVPTKLPVKEPTTATVKNDALPPKTTMVTTPLVIRHHHHRHHHHSPHRHDKTRKENKKDQTKK